MDYFNQQDMHVFEYKFAKRRTERRSRWIWDSYQARLDFRLQMRHVEDQLIDVLIDDAKTILRGSLEMLTLEVIHGAINAVPLNPNHAYGYRFGRRG